MSTKLVKASSDSVPAVGNGQSQSLPVLVEWVGGGGGFARNAFIIYCSKNSSAMASSMYCGFRRRGHEPGNPGADGIAAGYTGICGCRGHRSSCQ